MPLSFPLNPTRQFVGLGLGVSAGVGYNIDRRNALIGEFMWNWLYASDASLQPIRIALQSANINGHGNAFAFTANYRLELRGRTGGIYFIGGPGWIYRTASLSTPIPAGTTIPCSPFWRWWGYDCAAGPIVSNLTQVHSNAGAPGVNGGIGFTVRTGEAPYRAYIESRYYFAPTGSVSTKLLTVTVGIRY
jgi:Outer membrane protein beta-barrel domain